MTHPQPPQDMQRVFEDCDSAYLRQLRQAAGMELTALARTACLSVAQVRHLEGDGEGFFYSPAIKRQSYKRLLMILGAAPPTANPKEALQAAAHGLERQTRQPINRMVALGERTQALQPSSRSWARYFAAQGLWRPVSWFCLFALALWGAWWGSQQPLPTWLDSLRPNGVVHPATSLPAADVTPLSGVAGASGAVPAVSASDAVLLAPVIVAPPLNGSENCADTSEVLPELVPTEAHKVGNYVYLVSDKPMTVCVVDGAQQATWLELKPGEGRSVYGKSPWQLTGAQLYQAQIYFQGHRLTLPEGNPQRLRLVEKPLTR